jgi:hypothetical protein
MAFNNSSFGGVITKKAEPNFALLMLFDNLLRLLFEFLSSKS